jgi:hypothetical protein
MTSRGEKMLPPKNPHGSRKASGHLPRPEAQEWPRTPSQGHVGKRSERPMEAMSGVRSQGDTGGGRGSVPRSRKAWPQPCCALATRSGSLGLAVSVLASPRSQIWHRHGDAGLRPRGAEPELGSTSPWSQWEA